MAALEYATRNIRVNSVHPGGIKTNIVADMNVFDVALRQIKFLASREWLSLATGIMVFILYLKKISLRLESLRRTFKFMA